MFKNMFLGWKVGKLESWKVGRLERGEPAFGRQNLLSKGRLEGGKVGRKNEKNG